MRARRIAANAAVSTIYALTVSCLAAPPALLAKALHPTPVVDARQAPQVQIPGFAEGAAVMGLAPADEIVVEDRGRTRNGGRLLVATTSATAYPADDGVFFRRLSSQQLRVDPGVQGLAQGTLGTVVVAESELQVGHADGRVWIDFIDRFSDAIDEAAGRTTGLAGVEVRKRVAFTMTGFDDFVAELTRRGGASLSAPEKQEVWRDLVASGAVTHGDLEQTVTIEYPDGSQRSMPAEEFRVADVFGESGEIGSGAGTSCVIGCFEDVGVTVTFLGAVCLVAGAAVCAAACAVSAGVACIPCISGASLTCGLGAAAGTLGYCLAKCLFGVDPPTPTRTPTRTRTRAPTATPNRQVVYTIEPPAFVETGSEFDVAWTASSDHAANDWIAIFVPGADNQDYGEWTYLAAERAGVAQLVAPEDPGVYELRILLENGYLEPNQPARAPLSVLIANPGDCNGDERVTINELIIGITIALGRRSLDDCVRIDGNGDGIIQVAELIRAVTAALR